MAHHLRHYSGLFCKVVIYPVHAREFSGAGSNINLPFAYCKSVALKDFITPAIHLEIPSPKFTQKELHKTAGDKRAKPLLGRI